MTSTSKCRLAFVGLGWIGRHRLRAIVESGSADILALADSDAAALAEAHTIAPSALAFTNFEEALAAQPDGIVLATPSAMHSSQAVRALTAGVAVFCQKPLGRHRAEVDAAISAARRADRLLGVDFSYRYTTGLRSIRDVIRSGALGEVYAIDLTFHNAYGPDKPWFYDISQSGGGCLLDLGTHLIDFLHWTFSDPPIEVHGLLYSNGRRLPADPLHIEDFASGHIVLAGGQTAHLACSWRLHAGCDAIINVAAFGTKGGVRFRNIAGSFYDFVAERYSGTHTDVLATPPDDWCGRAAVAWARQLSLSPSFDESVETAGIVASTIDLLYGRSALADAPAIASSASTLTASTWRTPD